MSVSLFNTEYITESKIKKKLYSDNLSDDYYLNKLERDNQRLEHDNYQLLRDKYNLTIDIELLKNDYAKQNRTHISNINKLNERLLRKKKKSDYWKKKKIIFVEYINNTYYNFIEWFKN